MVVRVSYTGGRILAAWSEWFGVYISRTPGKVYDFHVAWIEEDGNVYVLGEPTVELPRDSYNV